MLAEDTLFTLLRCSREAGWRGVGGGGRVQKQRKEMEGKSPDLQCAYARGLSLAPETVRTAASEAQRGSAEPARRWAFLRFTGRHWVLSGFKLYPPLP